MSPLPSTIPLTIDTLLNLSLANGIKSLESEDYSNISYCKWIFSLFLSKFAIMQQ